jgi:1,4-alpha-glucan branching enzyme
MEELGYLLLVLHSHQPFIRHPELNYSFEENWLCEAIVESYLPLISICQGWLRDGVEARLTFSVTPSLCELFADPLLEQRCARYIDERSEFLRREAGRLRGQEPLGRLAQMHFERFTWSRQAYDGWQRNPAAAFRHLRDSRVASLIASAATHAYLPLWDQAEDFVRLQIELGAEHYQRCFGARPVGMWLPECGYAQSLDGPLRDSGIRYFFADAHGLLYGTPRPRFAEFAPVHTPCGVAAFGRDLQSHVQVWVKTSGYPGDPAYLDPAGDIGYTWGLECLGPLTHQEGRLPAGIRYYRGGNGWPRDFYDPRAAMARCEQHAGHFVQRWCERVRILNREMGRKPVLVALFDAEHFGHCWHEGPRWLDLVVRKLAPEDSPIRMITAEEYLRLYPANQVVSPSASSWGYHGYHETWLMGKNHWIYPAAYRAMDEFRELAGRGPGFRNAHRVALNQYLRELLLAQASDWAFNIWTDTTPEYARKRITEHLKNADALRGQIEAGAVDFAWLDPVRHRNNIFENFDLLETYSKIREYDRH